MCGYLQVRSGSPPPFKFSSDNLINLYRTGYRCFCYLSLINFIIIKLATLVRSNFGLLASKTFNKSSQLLRSYCVTVMQAKYLQYFADLFATCGEERRRLQAFECVAVNTRGPPSDISATLRHLVRLHVQVHD